ncbi:ATP-binding protein [Arthrobacter sp. Marseille-P9274]|uniref:ATP-binding protein n=1 Tax=Arthrobacter sp. Marseille-P9274 TaxID=2866572 RepID=UPI0021CA7C05|nr:ATP-binding protein [Arthrobacter sp. Marseille-P9274]
MNPCASWAKNSALLQVLDQRGSGLIITVDEIHAADRNELAHLAASIQHFIRDSLPIGLVFAGLPAAVSDLLNEGVATFLRRADKIDLHAAAIRDVEKSFGETFQGASFHIDPGLIREAAEATGGYPFLIQLVGYFLWREAEAGNGTVTPEAAGRAIEAADRRNARMVIEAARSALSPKDLEFLDAMAQDDGPSIMGDIARRLDAKPPLASNYRTRLVAAGLIEPSGYGRVDFAIPGLRKYLRSKPLP